MRKEWNIDKEKSCLMIYKYERKTFVKCRNKKRKYERGRRIGNKVKKRIIIKKNSVNDLSRTY